MSITASVPDDDLVAPEIVASIFYSASVSDVIAIVAEPAETSQRLLAQMGAALLHHNDPDGYADIVAAQPTYTGRRTAETRRYGLNSLKLTAAALEQWGFPHSMTSRLQSVDDYHSLEGGLLRAALEAASRLTTEDYQPVPIVRLTCGQLREDDLLPVMDQVRADADELRRAMLSD